MRVQRGEGKFRRFWRISTGGLLRWWRVESRGTHLKSSSSNRRKNKVNTHPVLREVVCEAKKGLIRSVQCRLKNCNEFFAADCSGRFSLFACVCVFFVWIRRRKRKRKAQRSSGSSFSGKNKSSNLAFCRSWTGFCERFRCSVGCWCLAVIRWTGWVESDCEKEKTQKFILCLLVPSVHGIPEDFRRCEKCERWTKDENEERCRRQHAEDREEHWKIRWKFELQLIEFFLRMDYPSSAWFRIERHAFDKVGFFLGMLMNTEGLWWGYMGIKLAHCIYSLV